MVDAKLTYGEISVISWQDIVNGESPQATFGLYTEGTPESEMKEDLIEKWLNVYDPERNYQPPNSGDYDVDYEFTPVNIHKAGKTIQAKGN